MGFTDDEIESLKDFHAKDRCSGLRIVSAVAEIIRIEITKTKIKSLVAVFQLSERYPDEPALIELRSKTLGGNLLAKLSAAIEDFIKNYLGEPQVVRCVEFLNKFIEDNPLCCCAEEITTAKQGKLDPKKDELKLKQKSSKIVLTLREGTYLHKASLQVPDDYPDVKVVVECLESGFPNSLQRYLTGQASEIARRCVEPPLNKKIANREPFVPKPSILRILTFLAEQVHGLPNQDCSVCHETCLPQNAVDVVNDEQHDLHVERIYCGHLYHFKCLVEYMKTPPFAGGKKCIICKQRIYHDKYKITPELAESRWAHQQARDRELEEVTDFFK